MKTIRTLILASLLIPALPARAAEDQPTGLSHALTLVHMFVRIAAESDASQASLRAIDEVLAGRNAAANEAVAGLLNEVLADVSPTDRATIAAIGRDLVSVARKNVLGLKSGESLFPDRSMEARRQLNAMGLSYHDPKQFLDAVKRNDVLAAELRSAYVGGRQEQFKLLLSQEDPAALGRMLVYYSYFGRARASKIAEIQGIVAQIDEDARADGQRIRDAHVPDTIEDAGRERDEEGGVAEERDRLTAPDQAEVAAAKGSEGSRPHEWQSYPRRPMLRAVVFDVDFTIAKASSR